MESFTLFSKLKHFLRRESYQSIRRSVLLIMIILTAASHHLHAQSSDTSNTGNTSETETFQELSTYNAREGPLDTGSDLNEDHTSRKRFESSPKSAVYGRRLSPGDYLFVGVQNDGNQPAVRPVDVLRVHEKTDRDVWVEIGIVPPPYFDPDEQEWKEHVRFLVHWQELETNKRGSATDQQEKSADAQLKSTSSGSIGYVWVGSSTRNADRQFLKPQLTRVPVHVPGTSFYVAPFVQKNDRTISLLVCVSPNLGKMTSRIPVTNDPEQNWANDIFTIGEQPEDR